MIRDLLASRFLAPALERKRGLAYRRFIPDVEKVLTSSLVDIKRFQQDRVSHILSAASNIPFYSDRFRSAGIDPTKSIDIEAWRCLAPIDRNDFVTLRYNVEENNNLVGDFIKSATGGTTQTPAIFYMNRNAVLQRHAATFYFNNLLGYKPGHRIAYIWGAARDVPQYQGLKGHIVQHWITRALFIPVSDMSEENMFRYFIELKKQRPRILQAYPSAIELFADFLLENNMRLSIPEITCTAESLSPTQRQKIQQAFGANPIEWYGAREAGRIATECREHDGMHINCHGLLVETTKDSGAGRVLLTDLWNVLMPLVRYEIGDAAEIDYSPCKCGSSLPRLKNIMGRLSDNFIRSDGTIVPGLILSHCVPEETQEVASLQIIQKDIKNVVLKIVPGKNYDANSTVRAIRERVASILGREVILEIEFVEQIPREKSGKVRLVKNELPYEKLRKYF